MFEMHARVAGVPLIRPRWLPPPDLRTCQLVPLPPLRNLTTLMLNVGIEGDMVSYDCRHHERIRVLTDTIASLKKLSILQLYISGPKEHWFSMGSAIFFSCPSTLETLTIFIESDSMSRQPDPDPSVETQNWYLQAKEGDKDDQGNLVAAPRREEPLVKLRDLQLWEMDTATVREDIIAILEHCPNIETFQLPPVSRMLSGSDFAGIIAGLCPRVTSLTTYQFPDGSDNELTFRVMEALPAQQLETFSCSNSDFHMDEIAARSIFQRHSTTLRHINFAFCGQIQSKAMLTILVECVALEKLELRQDEAHGGIIIHLEDAIEKPWMCTKVQRFDLTVGVFELELEPDQEPYYDRDSPIILTPAEEQQFAMLEKLYRQIGLLTEVRRLDLRLEWLDDEGFPTQDSAYDNNTFPALLSLGDARTNRPGYLHLLAGLKKLQKLRGSVFVDVDETKETVNYKVQSAFIQPTSN
ncbi:hypothetical protein BGZ95_000392 [Linnemannia exigua]|uniref:Uncharacterized protein n=1 Tax=Linnemannia exigua TaxID=604196 RepID=A0AAD4DKY8_9FUNG|nr:hypothetical protein BGZ95_000392 [Linnemannia exigua]